MTKFVVRINGLEQGIYTGAVKLVVKLLPKTNAQLKIIEHSGQIKSIIEIYRYAFLSLRNKSLLVEPFKSSRQPVYYCSNLKMNKI